MRTIGPTPGKAPGGRGPSGGAGPDLRLGRSRRVTHSAEIREAYAQGCRFVGRCMVLWLRRGPGEALRLGVVSGRKVGGAVDRNRARRRLRELFRRNRHRLAGTADVILVARRGVVSCDWPLLEAEFLALAREAGLGAATGPGPVEVES